MFYVQVQTMGYNKKFKKLLASKGIIAEVVQKDDGSSAHQPVVEYRHDDRTTLGAFISETFGVDSGMVERIKGL